MFEINKQFCVTPTEKLLWNIWQELAKINEPATIEQTQPNLDGLKRNELMALVKALPNKPDGWSNGFAIVRGTPPPTNMAPARKYPPPSAAKSRCLRAAG